MAYRDFFDARGKYGLARSIASKGEVSDSKTAERFLRDYWTAAALQPLSFQLLDKIDEVEKGTLSRILDKGLGVIPPLGLLDIIDPVMTKTQSLRWADEYEREKRVALAEVDDWLAKKYWKASSYTLELAQSPRIVVRVHSPVELMVRDLQARITGMVEGKQKNEIPYSVYNDNAVTIFFPTNSYSYDVLGTNEGSYDLEFTRVAEGDITAFVIPNEQVSASARHQYTVDWDTVSKRGKGVTQRVDSDGDGAFERTVYLSPVTEGGTGVPPWVWLAVSTLVAAMVAAIVSLRFAKR
jgi:hypothetical protein